ncbi:unnamed protein product [Echinostoma caproni]|uniref:Alpha-galactosidase n=1 Tax=Echinostoma caproni TaxID=27848 RepID=A0A183AUZ3_9TREM|nr:unnamed protein product [Echinostoma caproni]
MGWTTSLRFGCETDCKTYPRDCISENLVRRIADRMKNDGWVELGYNHLVLDDCWSAKKRDPRTQRLELDPERFPGGIESLQNYLKNRGIHLGLSLNYGTVTCRNYPGSLQHLEQDAHRLANWGVEYIKLDSCFSPPDQLELGSEMFANYLKDTHRPVVFGCTYPAYINWTSDYNLLDWDKLVQVCDSWRWSPPTDGSWRAVRDTLNLYKRHVYQLQLAAYEKHWNDFDALALGNYGLSDDQKRVQMGMWCMHGSPLMISADFDTLDPVSKELLRNKNLIAINQDDLNYPSVPVTRTGENIQFWIRQLKSIPSTVGALTIINMNSGGITVSFAFSMRTVFSVLPHAPSGYSKLIDAFTGTEFAVVSNHQKVTVPVNPNGIVLYLIQPVLNGTRENCH